MGSASHTPPVVHEQAVGGAIASCLASIPLAIGYALYGFYSSGEVWSTGEVVMGTLLTAVFAVLMTLTGSIMLMSVYAVTARASRWRVPLLLLGAVVCGVIVEELWNGAALFEDLENLVLFASFGFYSGLAFWVGADVWRPIR
jgi:hypothetical protein